MTGEAMHLSDRQRVAWLQLIRTENVGPVSFHQLIRRFGSAQTALEMLPELAISGGGRRPRIPPVAAIEAEIETARRFGASLIAHGEPDYPPTLMGMDNPPPIVAVKGDMAVFRQTPVAIVGARNASLSGMKIARQLATDIGAQGYAVISGLARGIDTAAHHGSIATGTVAVLAGGLDHPYPPENIALFNEIPEKGGAVITEMPFGWQARAVDFPRRNRIIAGLSLGLVVVEAALRSGSLVSARLAGEMGRLIFAVPGSPLDPRSAGANNLLKQGVIPVTEAADILEHIAPLHAPAQLELGLEEEESRDFAPPPPSDEERQRIVEALSPTPVAVDEIIRHCRIHPSQLLLILLELDLAGRIERHAGGAVSLLSDK